MTIENSNSRRIAASATTLDDFLAGVQHRAFAMTRTATGHDEDAMDIVQDAMIQLVKRYSDRSVEELRLLFYRILYNRINDFFRRRKVRDKVAGWLPGDFQNEDESASPDPFQKVIDPAAQEPERHLERHQDIEKIQMAVRQLSRRQREAFMLRCWEGLSTIETASAMQCSEGSVKTHYSRALESLRGKLAELNQ
jgi:RNA polymerase sigma-70 factor (ECF subfamily)